MLYVVFCVAIAVIVFIISMLSYYNDVGESLGNALVSFLVSAMVCVSAYFLINVIVCCNIDVEDLPYVDQSYSMNILALKDNSEDYGDLYGGGKFFLGCGTMTIEGHSGSKMVYTYLKDTPDGVIMCQTDCDKSYVKTTNEHPKVEIQTGYYVHTVSDFAKTWLWLSDDTFSAKRKTIFYVPEGSICYDYEIDME